MNFKYQHTFQVRNGQVQRPQPKAGADIEAVRENEYASLMYDRFQEVNQEVCEMVGKSAGFDLVNEPKPKPASQRRCAGVRKPKVLIGN